MRGIACFIAVLTLLTGAGFAETPDFVPGRPGDTDLLAQTTQLDAGLEFGLTDDTDDLRFFFGWARRF